MDSSFRRNDNAGNVEQRTSGIFFHSAFCCIHWISKNSVLNIAVTFSALIILLTSCDVVDAPKKKDNPVDTSFVFPVDTSKPNTTIRKVFLEEYTGHLCVNCPDAADTAKYLKAMYKDTLVMMRIHAGTYTDKQSPFYTTDFTCSTGDELLSTFIPSKDMDIKPQGMISRMGWKIKYLFRKSEWEPQILSIKNDVPKIAIKLLGVYVESKQAIYVKADVIGLANDVPNYNLSIYLIENDIKDYQKDNRKTPPDVPDYDHSHILRASFSGTWGEQLRAGKINKNDTITKKYKYTIDPGKGWKTENLKVIAIVHDIDKAYDIFQVEEKELKYQK